MILFVLTSHRNPVCCEILCWNPCAYTCGHAMIHVVRNRKLWNTLRNGGQAWSMWREKTHQRRGGSTGLNPVTISRRLILESTKKLRWETDGRTLIYSLNMLVILPDRLYQSAMESFWRRFEGFAFLFSAFFFFPRDLGALVKCGPDGDTSQCKCLLVIASNIMAWAPDLDAGYSIKGGVKDWNSWFSCYRWLRNTVGVMNKGIW